MKRTAVNKPVNFRNKALVGAIVSALALGATGTAAAESAYTYLGTQTLTLQNYLQMVGNQQELAAPVSASVADNEMGYRGPASAGQLTVSGNTFQALTRDATTNLLGANGADNSIDLGLLGIQDDSLVPGDANQGIGILSGQLNTGAVSTLLDHDNIGLDLTDYTVGNATVTGNTLNSTALVNGASNRATGALNTTPFSSTTAGVVTFNDLGGGNNLTAAGGVTIGNAQMASGVVSSAKVTDSNVSLVNAGAVGNAPVNVADNTVMAADTGNRGDNRFSATAGAVSYAGTVAMVNGQENVGGSNTAMVDGTDIGAELDGNPYAGDLNVSGNTMSASAQGNDAAALDTSGNLMRGNAISFGQGIDVSGTSVTASLNMSSFGSLNSSANADLALLNAQRNQGGAITGTVQGSRIGAEVDGLIDGSLTASQNHVAASAGGNSVINLVSTRGASFDASVAAGNLQMNDATSIGAVATQITMGAELAAAGATGDVTVGNSSIGATATGSNAQTVVDLQASNFNASSPSSNAFSGSSFANQNAGIIAGNLQTNSGADISASTTESTLGAVYGSTIIGSNVSVDNNAVNATAGGNGASTSILLQGTTGALSAALDSQQQNANDVTATATDDFIGVMSNDALADSTLTASGDSLNARASANQATNRLATEFASSLTSSAAGNFGSIDALGSFDSRSAALILQNGQIADGAIVSATAANSQIGVVGSGPASDVAFTVQGNSAGASAIGNSASNSLTPNAGSLVSAGPGNGIASLGNLQQMGGDSVAAVQDVGAGFVLGSDAVDVTGSASGNNLSAFAGGNMAGGDGGTGNVLSASGTSLVDSGMVSAGANVDPMFQQASATFVLQNKQGTQSGLRSATIQGGSVGGAMGGAATESTLSVSGNGLSADARDNYATNALALDFDSALTTTGVLQSVQTSIGGMSSSVIDSQVGLTAATMLDSSLTVSDNSVAAKAVANTASNQFSVKASELSGNDSGGAFGAPSEGAAGIGLPQMVAADYGVVNTQTSGGSIMPSVAGIQIGVSADTGDLVSSPATVSGNTVTVLGQGNSAGNGLVLSGTSVDASAALSNSQSTSSFVNASASDVHIDINADGQFVDLGQAQTVNGNSVGVYAGLNDTTNTLRVDATNTVTGTVGQASASNDSDSFVGALADFTLANLQDSTGMATASLVDARTGILFGSGATGDGSSMTVTGNQFDAQASGNNAGNSVALNGTGSVAATAAVDNQQSNAGGISTTVSGVDVSAGNRDTGNGIIIGNDVTVADNRVSGSANGNSATNAISVSSVALNGAGFIGTEASSSDVSTAVADYALNNVQGNTAAISSTMSNITIGSNLDGGVGSVLNSHAAIGSNMVMASSSGNSASNSITLASVTGFGMPSASLVSSQVNSAAISATVNHATIGAIAGIASNSPVTVNNNTISASATGNSAINHIGIGR